MSRNAFEQKTDEKDVKHKLTLDQIQTILTTARKSGNTMRSAFLEHGEEFGYLSHAEDDYGITNIDYLFPDFKALSTTPELLTRRVEWVSKVLNGVKKSPFSKIKTIVADLTAAEARAKGYIKGTEKKDEVISLLKRTTSPATIYKKQKLDRDDIVDITDFDVIAWLKWEIRYMLDEEIARAILLGDGRASDDEDKIKDPAGNTSGEGIRSIYLDHEMYAHQVELPANVTPKSRIEGIVRSRSAYRGSGTPIAFMSDSQLTDLLLIEDRIGRRLYETEAALASALRVSEIVSVEVMEEYVGLIAIIVNLSDYTLGATRGGEVNFFEDFDIDFNQNKYLMETRPSGALTKPKSALVITRIVGTSATPTSPSFNGETNTITIPTTTGINYTVEGDIVAGGPLVITEPTVVEAEAKPAYYIPSGLTTSWTFTPTEEG